MNREISFRGKRLDNGEWVEGDLARRKSRFAPQLNTTYGISDEFGGFAAIDPATVGQYTGLLDKNGTQIFEDDIVHLFGGDGPYAGMDCVEQVVYCDGGFCATDWDVDGIDGSHRRYFLGRFDYEVEVIGNIHDNPELLEVQP